MKFDELVKFFISAVVTIVIAAIPVSIFYWIWSSCMSLVPATAYAGVIKIGITLALVMVGGGATIWFTIIFAAGAVALCMALLD